MLTSFVTICTTDFASSSHSHTVPRWRLDSGWSFICPWIIELRNLLLFACFLQDFGSMTQSLPGHRQVVTLQICGFTLSGSKEVAILALTPPRSFRRTQSLCHRLQCLARLFIRRLPLVSADLSDVTDRVSYLQNMAQTCMQHDGNMSCSTQTRRTHI